MPKRAHLNSPQGDKVHWVLGPYFTEAFETGVNKGYTSRGIQGTTQTWIIHRTADYTNRRDDTLTQIACKPTPTLGETDSYLSKN